MLFTRLPDKKYLLGIDMGETGCQISCLNTRRLSADMDPVTFSHVPGGEAFEFPYAAADGWREETEKGSGPDRSRPVSLPSEEEEPAVLATENFLRYCFHCLRRELLPEEIEAVTFTAEQMDERTSGLIERAVGRILPDLDQVRFEDHVHSFYHYILMQDEEQRRESVMLVDGSGSEKIRIVTLSFNKKTKPIVCIPEETEMSLSEYAEGENAQGEKAEEDGDKPSGDGNGQNPDAALSQIVEPLIRSRKYSASYLTGDALKGGWMKRSADLICKGRRAFQGDNLFSKGAAYGAMIAGGLASRANRYFYLGKDALRCGIGIRCTRKLRDVICPLLDAGTDWYDARAAIDVIVEEGNEITLVQTSLDRGSSREITVLLENLPERPPRTTRLRITLSMSAADRMLLEAEDLGFGEIFPSSGMKWEQEIMINV